MISVIFPDDSVKKFDKGVKIIDVAKSISEGLARKVISASFNNETLELNSELITDYVKLCLKKNDNHQYILKCDPRWESACFKLTSHEVWFDLKKIDLPIKIILTPNSVVCNETSQKRIKKLNPQTEICFIKDTSHMLPLERTEEVAKEINNFLT